VRQHCALLGYPRGERVHVLPGASLVLAIICLGIAALYAGPLPMTRSAQLSAG
jgi:hypothetical protein